MTTVAVPARSASAQRVLDVALELFGRHGYDGTSLQLIADQLGVTKAAVYYHFRTKGEILTALVQPAFDDLDRLLVEASTCGRAGTRREQGLRSYIDYLLRHRAVAAFLDRDVAALAQPEVRGPKQALDARVRALLTAGAEDCPGRAAEVDPVTGLWAAATLRGLSAAVLSAPAAPDAWLRDELLEMGRHMLTGYRRAQRRTAGADADDTT